MVTVTLQASKIHLDLLVSVILKLFLNTSTGELMENTQGYFPNIQIYKDKYLKIGPKWPVFVS